VRTHELRVVASESWRQDHSRPPTLREALELLARACELKPESWKLIGLGILAVSGTITVLGWWFFFVGLVGALGS
jgi:hypothetical protein